jgi:hypothetical protein
MDPTATTARTGNVLAVSELVVSYDVRRGEIFGLLGPDGAGRTSTLSAIEGLLTHRTDGEREPWFGSNHSGVGFRPYAWPGWLILVVVVLAIVTVVVLFRTGVL